ncbi:MAG: MltA domain-containing protein [Alphaproteobacteria bacterium]|nr:MltA domain-containing protein [Alphaproteobacteria bacterium]
MRRSYFVIWAGTLLLALGILLWFATRPAPPVPKGAGFLAVTFADLPGWRSDNQSAALSAFLVSCRKFASWPQDRLLSGQGAIGGKAGDWAEVCAVARALPVADPGRARLFFEAHFKPLAVRFASKSTGLFTGYYEPLLHGSRIRGGPYIHPLYGLPADLVRVNLGEFSDGLSGRHIVGRLDGRRLRPYPERRQIEAGALDGLGLPVVYVDDPVDAFFLQIQGSGRVALAGGGEMRLGYAGGNGRRYYAIGRELIKRGILNKTNVSMQSIRAWLHANPEAGRAVMDLNLSYVFFRELTGPSPIGALGVALTPGRSIAVDRRLIPLGIPIWLQASRPGGDPGTGDEPLNRLVVAQDTGGAIKGGVRGDMFWGHGAEAAAIAGRMKHTGSWFLLLPNALADRF